MGALNHILNRIKNIKYRSSNEYCYTNMEKRGVAIFGCCCGLVGGDFSTDFLQYQCIDCKYHEMK